MTNTHQIEQFIESIFPSQQPDAIAPNAATSPASTSEDILAEKARAAEARSDNFWMGVAMIAVVGIMSLFMVRNSVSRTYPLRHILNHSYMPATIEQYTDSAQLFVAWMAGARFDLMLKDLSGIFGSGSAKLDRPAMVTPVGHGEL